MHQLQETQSLPTQWKDSDKEPTIDQQLLDIIPEEEWLSPGEIYNNYKYRKKDPATQQTISKYLNELERQGELEVKGKTHNRKYRKADKPIKETRENYSSPLSEGLPGFMKQRIRKEVRIVLEEEIQRIDKRIEDKVKSSRRDITKGDSKKSSDSNPGEEKQLILESLSSSDYRPIGEVMDTYEDRSEDPLSRRSVLRRLKGLMAEDKIDTKGERSQREYRLKP